MFQKDGDQSKQDAVVLLLQDMLEVVTRDMMLNEVRLGFFFFSFQFEVNLFVCWHPSNSYCYI